jgi:hypothetical protein
LEAEAEAALLQLYAKLDDSCGNAETESRFLFLQKQMLEVMMNYREGRKEA